MTREELSKLRIKTLEKIDEKFTEYNGASRTRKNQLDQEIYELGKQLSCPFRKARIKELTSKGKDLTTSEILELRQQGFTLEELSRKIGISYTTLYRVMNGRVNQQPGTFREREKDYIAIAAENGISFGTYRNRRETLGWSQEKASTKLTRKRVVR